MTLDWQLVSRTINVIGILVLVVIVAPFAVYAVPQVVGASHSYVVLSDSMQPAIEAGDVVIVDSTGPGAVERGDIITFQSGDPSSPPTTHRVVEVLEGEGGPSFRTKGDANEDPDQGVVPPGQLIGEVLLIIPYIGYVIQFANTSTGFLLLVGLPFGLLLLSEIRAVVGALSGPGSADEPTGDGGHEGSPEAPVSESTSDDTVMLTVTPADLRLTTAVLLGLTAYSAIVTYVLRTGWSAAVFVGAASGAGLIGSIIVFGGAGDRSGSVTGSADNGDQPPSLLDHGVDPVNGEGSVDRNAPMALGNDLWIVAGPAGWDRLIDDPADLPDAVSPNGHREPMGAPPQASSTNAGSAEKTAFGEDPGPDRPVELGHRDEREGMPDGD